MRKNKIKRGAADRAFSVVNNIVMILLGLIMVYPVYYAIMASLSSADKLVAHQGMLFYPLSPSMQAYRMAFRNPMLLRGYANTLFVVVVGTIVNLILTSIGAYFLSRKNVRLQKPVLIMIVLTMFFSGGMIPFYFAVRGVGLDGSLWALILPSGINTFNLIIMRTAFEGIPGSIEESARIDGAGHITILYRIILPMAKASLAVIALYYGVAHWNAWFHAMLFLKERTQYPLQLILREILIQGNTADMAEGSGLAEMGFIGETIKYAVIVISTLPIMCVYPFLQKYFAKGAMLGAVKE